MDGSLEYKSDSVSKEQQQIGLQLLKYVLKDAKMPDGQTLVEHHGSKGSRTITVEDKKGRLHTCQVDITLNLNPKTISIPISGCYKDGCDSLNQIEMLQTILSSVLAKVASLATMVIPTDSQRMEEVLSQLDAKLS